MNRRRFLSAAAGAVASLSGCTTDLGFGDGGPREFTEPYSSDRVELSPRTAIVRSSFAHLTGPDAADVAAEAGWYLFVRFSVVGEMPAPHRFRLAWGDVRREGWRRYGGVTADRIRKFEPSNPLVPSDDAWVGFAIPGRISGDDVPVLELSEGGDVRVGWRLRAADATELRREPPAFDLQAVASRDTAPAGNPFDVVVVVHNEGGDGVFRGVFNYRAPTNGAESVEGRVGAETTASIQHTVSGDGLVGADAGTELRGRFRSAGGDAEFGVELD